MRPEDDMKGHVDEGTIHAWLDGALDAAESARVESHVAECADCGAVVAEARGLIAASSRILTALDDVPGDVIPERPMVAAAVAPLAAASAPADVVPITSARRAPRRSWGTWRAAAAILVMAGATGVVLARRGVPNEERPAATESVGASDTATAGAAPNMVASAAPAPALSPAPAMSGPVPAALPREAAAPAVSPMAPAAQARAREAAPVAADARIAGEPMRALADTASVRLMSKSVAVAALPTASARSDSVLPLTLSGAVAAAPAPRRAFSEARSEAARAPVAGAAAADAASRPRLLRDNAAGGVIAGTVSDANGHPIVGSSIQVRPMTNGIVVTGSDTAGRFLITRAPLGMDTLVIRRVGFAPQRVAVSVTLDDTAHVSVALTQDVLQLNEVVVTSVGASVSRSDRGARERSVPGCYRVDRTIANVIADTVRLRANGRGDGKIRWSVTREGALQVTTGTKGVRLSLTESPNGWSGDIEADDTSGHAELVRFECAAPRN